MDLGVIWFGQAAFESHYSFSVGHLNHHNQLKCKFREEEVLLMFFFYDNGEQLQECEAVIAARYNIHSFSERLVFSLYLPN